MTFLGHIPSLSPDCLMQQMMPGVGVQRWGSCPPRSLVRGLNELRVEKLHDSLEAHTNTPGARQARDGHSDLGGRRLPM